MYGNGDSSIPGTPTGDRRPIQISDVHRSPGRSRGGRASGGFGRGRGGADGRVGGGRCKAWGRCRAGGGRGRRWSAARTFGDFKDTDAGVPAEARVIHVVVFGRKPEMAPIHRVHDHIGLVTPTHNAGLNTSSRPHRGFCL